jgi:hypothetical protein
MSTSLSYPEIEDSIVLQLGAMPANRQWFRGGSIPDFGKNNYFRFQRGSCPQVLIIPTNIQ